MQSSEPIDYDRALQTVRAATTLVEQGWQQNMLHRHTDRWPHRNKHTYCVIGALGIGSGIDVPANLGIPANSEGDCREDSLVTALCVRLCDLLGLKGTTASAFGPVAEVEMWNDTKGRSKAEVLAALHRLHSTLRGEQAAELDRRAIEEEFTATVNGGFDAQVMSDVERYLATGGVTREQALQYFRDAVARGELSRDVARMYGAYDA